MSIRQITKEQLRRMGDQEGLVLQGCGGDPQEWLDGINQILTDEGILKKGTRFEEAYPSPEVLDSFIDRAGTAVKRVLFIGAKCYLPGLFVQNEKIFSLI